MRRSSRILSTLLAALMIVSMFGGIAAYCSSYPYYPYYPNGYNTNYPYYSYYYPPVIFNFHRNVSLGNVKVLAPTISTPELIINDRAVQLRVVGLNSTELSRKNMSISPNASGTALNFTEELSLYEKDALMLTVKQTNSQYAGIGIWCTVDAIRYLDSCRIRKLKFDCVDAYVFDIAELLNAANSTGASELLITVENVTDGDDYDALAAGKGLNSAVSRVTVYDNTKGRTDISGNIAVEASINFDSDVPTLIAYALNGERTKLQTEVLVNQNTRLLLASASVPAGSAVAAIIK